MKRIVCCIVDIAQSVFSAKAFNRDFTVSTFLEKQRVQSLEAGVGNCFGLPATSRSRKLVEGRTFLRTHWYIILIDLHFKFGIRLKTNNY